MFRRIYIELGQITSQVHACVGGIEMAQIPGQIITQDDTRTLN